MSQVSQQDLAMFAQIAANHPRFVEYLTAERERTVKSMTHERDPVLVNRRQGDSIRLTKLIDLLTNAKTLLTR